MSKAKKLLYILKQVIEIIPIKYKRRIPFVVLFSILSSGLELFSIALIVPFISVALDGDKMMQNAIIKAMCELVGINNKYTLIIFLAVVLVLAFALKNLTLIFVRCYQNNYSICVQKELAILLFNSHLNRPYSFFLDNNTGVLVGRINDNVTSIYNILNCYISIISEGFTTVAILVFILYMDPVLAIGVLLVAIICVLTISLWLRAPISAAASRYYQAINESNKALTQGITAVKEIIVMRRRTHFIEAFDESCEAKAGMQRRFQFYNMLPERLIEMLFVSSIALIVAYKMRWGVEMSSFVASLAGFAMGAYRLLPSMGKFTTCINSIIFSKPSFDAGYNAIKEVEKYSENSLRIVADETSEKKVFSEELVIRDLTFRYKSDKPFILDDLELSIRKGEAIGIIGESGSGKSTLVDVLIGLLRPEKGGVYMDGIDIYSIPKSWSSNVGYVPQSVFLLDASIRENIGFGIDKSKIDDDRVWKVLDLANLRGFIEQLDGKLDASVGERGIQLSGGQRQRIAIARALYSDPSILILDEATSALDNETEEAVMESIENLIGNKTLIIVAHRLTTIRRCDRIYQIDSGKARIVSKEELGII